MITLTEYEKKQNGEIYDARDSELRAQQNRAKDLMREYNIISAADNDKRIRVLKLLIANEIRSQTGADFFEIELVNPYSNDYNTVLDEAQRDQNIQARPEIKNKVENIAQYDTIILGYPNWWASIPMPIATFLEEYDLSGKTIIPFCSHGGGRFGQSLTAITKLAPNSTMGEALSIHYSGGSSMPGDVSAWLEANNIPRN